MSQVIGIAPSNHGTDFNGLVGLLNVPVFGPLVVAFTNIIGPAFIQQTVGSDFQQVVYGEQDTDPNVIYTNIITRNDEIVTPYTQQALEGGDNVTNIVLQDRYPGYTAGHLGVVLSPQVWDIVLEELEANPEANPSFIPKARNWRRRNSDGYVLSETPCGGVRGIAATATAPNTATARTPRNTAAVPACTVGAPRLCTSPSPKTVLATAPKTATPTALPRDRANMWAPETTPRSPQSTLDCAAIRLGSASRPSPQPVTKHSTATTATFGWWTTASSAPVPARTRVAPIAAVFLNPIRR